ncbi:hypothetical protein QE416_000294 [Microbacterium sp. SORGH_AS 421]|nr:hypothetical protein [Microbacterium sp. SORGH_AS_0421]
MNDGSVNTVHHPDDWVSEPGRNEVMNRPNVGIVQKKAITMAAIVAPFDVRRLRAMASCLRVSRATWRAERVSVVGSITTVEVVIALPSASGSGAR